MTGFYTRARSLWGTSPDATSLIRQADVEKWDQSILELKNRPPADYVIANDSGTAVATPALASMSTYSGSDFGAVMQSAMTALNSAAGNPVGLILIVGNHTAQTIPSVGRVANGTTPNPGILTVRGVGAKVTLTSVGRRFLDFTRVADYDQFGNLLIEDILIDAASLDGRHHVVIGNMTGASENRLVFRNITVRRVRTVNVPTDTSGAEGRSNIYLNCNHPNAGEATQTTTTDIRVEDCDFSGGLYGIGIGASTQGVGYPNHYIDRVWITRCRHDTLTTMTGSLRPSANFHIGGGGQGGSVWITDCHGNRSGDVGIELNAFTYAKMSGCHMRDANGSLFYHTNYNTVVDANGQKIIWDNCHGYRSASMNSNSSGWLVNNTSLYGGATVPDNCLEIRGCTYHRTGPATITTPYDGIVILDVVRKIVIDDFETIVEGVALATGAGSHQGVTIQTTGTGGDYTRTFLKNVRLTLAAAITGSGTMYSYGVMLGGKQVVDLDGLDADYGGCTGVGNLGLVAVTLGNGGGSHNLRGVIRRVNVVRSGNSNSTAGVRVFGSGSGTTISPDKITIEDCDFKNVPTAGYDIYFDDATNRPFVNLQRNRMGTYPMPSAAAATSNFTTATFTTATGNRYIGGTRALIHFANGTGAAVTAIDVSKDGTTYENAYTQASGVMANSFLLPVDNGDYVKITFATTQPTVRILPER